MTEELRLAWTVVNPYGDKTISRKQLLDAVYFSGRNPSRKNMQDFCEPYGPDAGFTFDDFVKFCLRLQPTTLSELLNAFEMLDVNGDGRISKPEMNLVLGKNGEHLTEKEVDEIWKEFDRSGDGEIDFKEFGNMMASLSDEIHSSATRQRLMDQLGKMKAAVQPPVSQGDPIGSKTKHTARRRAGIQEVPETTEPSDLQSWACERLRGTFQATDSNAVFSEHYAFVVAEPCDIFLSLRLQRDAVDADAAIFVLKIDSDGDTELVGFSHTHVNLDPCLQLSLEAGDYIVVPFSTGCRLRKRAQQPKRGVAKVALTEVFHRIDLDNTGALRRREYDLLLLRTDGEACDDETWEYMTGTFSDKKDQLDLKAFLAMYTHAAEDSESFYKQFEALGYNKHLERFELYRLLSYESILRRSASDCSRALQLDEAVCFTLFCFVSKKKALKALTAMPYDQARVDAAVIRSIINNGKKESVVNQLNLYSHRCGDMRVSLALENRNKLEAAIVVDLSASTNIRTSAGRLRAPVSVPPRSEQIVVHCMPDDLAAAMAVKIAVGSK